jgi:hypothetical protein
MKVSRARGLTARMLRERMKCGLIVRARGISASEVGSKANIAIIALKRKYILRFSRWAIFVIPTEAP